jgi:hypothetical protein
VDADTSDAHLIIFKCLRAGEAHLSELFAVFLILGNHSHGQRHIIRRNMIGVNVRNKAEIHTFENVFRCIGKITQGGFFSPAISGMTVLALKPVPLSESQGSLRKVYPAYVIFNVALRI